MPLPDGLENQLRLPAISAPMFLTSGPDLVVEVCRSGMVGAFPALNQRSSQGYADWLDEIAARLDGDSNAAPYAVNLIVHKTNERLEADLKTTIDKEVPIVITSLGAVSDLATAVHGYGGLVFHDVVNMRHAQKAIDAGVDGLIAVCAGAGGHAGMLNPFAFVSELRAIFDGTIILAGGISTGRHIAAAQMMGADMAYIGTRFIATDEAMVPNAHKTMILDSKAADIVYTANISGVHANFLRQSLTAAGLDPDALPSQEDIAAHGNAVVWKDLWSAGQGVGAITDILPAADLCNRLIAEYQAATLP